MTEATRQARDAKYVQPHPWEQRQRDKSTASSRAFEARKQREAGLLPADYDPRFDRLYSQVTHHVKDGRPLTDRGAELLAREFCERCGAPGVWVRVPWCKAPKLCSKCLKECNVNQQR